ncbi:MAG: sirohydrochlorin chelatase [Streptosporangiales bacterium]
MTEEWAPTPPLLLVAHGSRDPRAQQTVERAAERVRARLPGTAVRTAFLDFADPRPADALVSLAAAGSLRVVAVPFLLTAAYHVRVDLPAAVREAQNLRPELDVTVTPALGPDPLLLDAADRRVREVGVLPGNHEMGVVLAAAGSSDPAATAAVQRVATEYRATRGGWRVLAAYASQVSPTPAEAVRMLHGYGFETVLVLSYLLAPGRFQDSLDALAVESGVRVTAPLADTPEVAAVVADRYRDALPSRPRAAAVTG